MDDTLADESGIPFLNANDDVPVHSTPIKGGNVPLPSTKHVLKKMVQKTRQVQDANPDFTASESIQAIQLSDTQALNGRDRDPVQSLGPRGQGQHKDHGQSSTKKAFSLDRDDHFSHLQGSGGAYRRKREADYNHVYEKDNLRPRSTKDSGHGQDSAGLGSKRSELHPLALKPNKTPTSMYEPTLSRHSIDRLSRNFEQDIETDRETRPQSAREIRNHIDREIGNHSDRETRYSLDRLTRTQTDGETRNSIDRLRKAQTDRETRNHADRETRNHVDRDTRHQTDRDSRSHEKQTDRVETDPLQKEDTVASKDNKTVTDSAYSSYATSKSQWSKQSTSQQYSTDRAAGKTERTSLPESKGRVDTLTRISREFLDDSSSNGEKKRLNVSSPSSIRPQASKSATTTKQKNSSLCELEGATLQKQRQEIELLVSELRDRDRELGDMADAHQQQLQAWEQDRHRLAAAEKLRTQYEEELQNRSSQLHRAINSLKTLRSRECDLRQEVKSAGATLRALRTENTQLNADVEQEKTLKRQLQERLKRISKTVGRLEAREEELASNLLAQTTLKRQLQERLERISETVGRLEAREEELATNLKLKERDISSATGQMQALSERLAQLDRRCKECQDREKEALAERDGWKRRHETSEQERMSLADELVRCRDEISRLSEENKSARQQLNLLHREMGMREKCKDELIESLKIKQERTDSQLRNIRELYEQQLKETAQLQQRLDTSRQIIQHQQSSLDEQQLSYSFQNRRNSDISVYSMDKSVSLRSSQSTRVKLSPSQSSKYREPESVMQTSNQHSSGYQSQISENQAARSKHSPVRSANYREPENDVHGSNHQNSVHQSHMSENQPLHSKHSPVQSAKYRESDYNTQSSNHQSLGYHSQMSENQSVRTKHSPVQSAKYSNREPDSGMQCSNRQSLEYQSQNLIADSQPVRTKHSPAQSAKYREPDYDMQSSNHQSSGYQSQLSENQTGLVLVLGNLPQNLHNVSDQQTGTSSSSNQHPPAGKPKPDNTSRFTASVQSDDVPIHIHFTRDRSPMDKLKKKLEFSEFSSERSPTSSKAFDGNQKTEVSRKHENASLPSDIYHESVPKLSDFDKPNADLQSPPRRAGFVIHVQQSNNALHAEQSDSSLPLPQPPPAAGSRETKLEPVQQQREIRNDINEQRELRNKVHEERGIRNEVHEQRGVRNESNEQRGIRNEVSEDREVRTEGQREITGSEQREVRNEGQHQREITGSEQREVRNEGQRQRETTTMGSVDSRLSVQEREEMDAEMERKYVFENKLRSFLEDLDDIDENNDSIWEDKTNNISLNVSMVEGSPASKLQKLLLESRLMIQNLEKSAESPSMATDRNKSNTPRQTVENSETEAPAKLETPSSS